MLVPSRMLPFYTNVYQSFNLGIALVFSQKALIFNAQITYNINIFNNYNYMRLALTHLSTVGQMFLCSAYICPEGGNVASCYPPILSIHVPLDDA